MITSEFKLKLEEVFKDKIEKIEALTNNVTLLIFSKRKILLKKVNPKCKNTYNFLSSQNVNNVLFPIKQIVFNNEIFFAFSYQINLDYPEEKKIINLIELMDEVHKKTGFTVRLNDINFKYFYRSYKTLDRIFQTLEMMVRECEANPNKGDYDWIILSKYHIFLDCKKIMYQTQRKIHKYLDNHGSAMYALNHGNLTLIHMINGKLISFDNAYIGIFVSDYAKLYVSLDDIKGEYFKDFIKKLDSYENDFYKLYFKFLVLYIYMINLRLSSYSSVVILNTYMQIASKVNRFLNLTSSF